MAKRIIHECDLTKDEIKEDDTLFTLKISKKGTRANSTYELSSSAAEKLLAQLNGTEQLPNNWSFSGSKRQAARTLGDLETDESFIQSKSDEQMIAEKRKQLTEAGVDTTPQEVPDDGNCRHINKTTIQTSLRNGSQYFYRRCKKCGREIPEMPADVRRGYTSEKPPTGVNIREIDV